MPTNTPSCTPKASGKTMKTKSVCDLAPWFLGRTPYFGLSMTLWLENLGKIFPFLVNLEPHLVGLPSLPKSDFFWGNPRSRYLSLNLCPFLSSACFFEEKKPLSLLFFPHESHESLFVFCFVAQKSHSFMVNWQLLGPRSELCRQGQAAQAELDCLEKVWRILLGRSV